MTIQDPRSTAGESEDIAVYESAFGTFRAKRTPESGRWLDNRYRIIGLLGSGATSDVYLAESDRAELVIIKWLTAGAARDAQIRQRFVLSARASMSVDHPAILRVFAVNEPHAAAPYLVMEALVGESLADYLEREGAVAEPLAVALATQVAAGLAAAHHVGIVHRDVKPANLFLLGERGAPVGIKIIDFGLAKDLSDPDGAPNSTNLVLGTAQYMPPEQVLADPIDGRTDVYALGVVLFRMLTGQLPFDLDPGADLFSHQLFSPAPPPSWLLENVDPRLERVILRCMRKHPENRYPSMAAVLADLELIRGGNHEIASVPLAREPDVYKPRRQNGYEAAHALAAYFGAEPPPPATVRFGESSAPPDRSRE